MTNAPRRVGCVLATVVLAFGGLALFARSSATAAVGTASCSPKTSSGGCYVPGEFCPTADHDTKGTTSDGEAIVCQNKNGWRWEPVAAANSQSSTATTVEGAASTTIAPEGATPTTVPASVATPTTAPVAVATPTTVAAAPNAALSASSALPNTGAGPDTYWVLLTGGAMLTIGIIGRRRAAVRSR